MCTALPCHLVCTTPVVQTLRLQVEPVRVNKCEAELTGPYVYPARSGRFVHTWLQNQPIWIFNQSVLDGVVTLGNISVQFFQVG